jgi:nucleoside-diphosphate-sugar epimerase
MQTILGAGGPIGIELAKSLKTYTNKIRLVSRNPRKVSKTDELMTADLLKTEDVRRAVKGSKIVYVTVGFPYNLKVWQSCWPKFMSDVIAACKEFNAKLVFFDNMYMYDKKYLGQMTEETPINPPSKKGKVRAEVAQMILDEAKAGRLTALIARSADFYGPGIRNSSMMNETIIKPLKIGGKANVLGNVNAKHSYTFTPDAGKATAMLGNSADTWNQVWHLPTASEPFTGAQWAWLAASELGVKPRFQKVNGAMVWVIGYFSPIMKEIYEMMYQNKKDYIFDSSKFEKKFAFKPTPYHIGLKVTLKADYPDLPKSS